MSSKLFLAVAVLAGFATYCFRRGNAAQSAKGEAKQDVTRWEGEGGNVPEVATPSPAPIPQSSYPGNGAPAQH